jgi:hypothetical protein
MLQREDKDCTGSQTVLAVGSTERLLANQFRTKSPHRENGKDVPDFVAKCAQ